MKNPSLREIQEWLCYTLTDPQGVQKSLENQNSFQSQRTINDIKNVHPLNLRKAPASNLVEWLDDHEKPDPVTRLRVYADAYYLRISGMLEENFRILFTYLGAKNFEREVSAFLSHYQSRSPTLDIVAKHFAEYLRAKNPRSLETDITTLEWASIEAIFARSPLLPDLKMKVNYFADENLSAKIILVFNPTMKILSLSHDLKEIFKFFEDSSKVPESKDFHFVRQTSKVLIFRGPSGIKIMPISESEVFLLTESEKGLALAEICHKLDSSGAGDGAVAHLGLWLESGLIADLKLLS